MSKNNNLNPLAAENDDDQQQDNNMGEKTISLDAMLENETDPKKRQEAEDAARAAIKTSMEDDMSYWARISSTVYGEEIKDGALDKVEDEFKSYARSWLLLGKGLDAFGDIAELKDQMDEKADQNQERKERKAKAAKKKAQQVALNAADTETRRKAAEAQRAAQAQRDAQRAKQKAELEATMFKPLEPETCPKVNFTEVLTLLNTIDEKYFAKTDADDVFEKLPELSKDQRDLVNQGFEHMMWMFCDPEFKKRYNYNQQDHSPGKKHELGQPVQAYFANVKDGSMYRRKLLSMQGLRNLIVYGPTIYEQMKKKLFVGNISNYGSDEGLQLMKTMTGTVVDLDTTVLRCSCQATLNTINAMNRHKKLPTFSDSRKFADSQQAKDMVMACGVPLLQDFAKKMKLTTDAQLNSRKINWKTIPSTFPVAHDNSTRGHEAVWLYDNAGQLSYSVNVPTWEDVNGALLKSPFHCLRHYAFIFAVFGEKKEELQKKLSSFFEDCIADSCFNFKWKAIEAFGEQLAHEGTIVDIIQRTQAENQAIFTMKFFEEDDDDQTKEIAEMTRLCKGKVGREVKTGKIREITGEDVAAWCKDASVKI